MNDPTSTFRARPRRLPLHMRIEKTTLGVFFDSEIMNLSRGGVFIRTDIPLPPGSEIDFEFTLPRSERVIHAEGIVVWARKRGTKTTTSMPDHPAGMGVQFRQIQPDDVDAILDEIESVIEIS